MQPKNIILITVDNLRKDYLEEYNFKKTKNNNILKLYQDSVVFSNAYSVGSNTPNVLPSIFTGFNPIFFANNKIPSNIKTLTEYLKNKGYTTRGFNQGNAWGTNYFGYGRGFDKLDSYLDISQISDSMESVRARARPRKINSAITFLMRIKSRIKRVFNKNKYMSYLYKFLSMTKHNYINVYRFVYDEYKLQNTFIKDILNYLNIINDKKRNFIWIHLMTNHWPWTPLFMDSMGDTIDGNRKMHKYNVFFKRMLLNRVKTYKNTILTLDYFIGLIIGNLKKRDIYDDSMIIFVSDHGELFNENNKFGHPSTICNELIQIPFMIKIPSNDHYIDNNLCDNSQIFEIVKNYVDNNDLLKNIAKHMLIVMNYKFQYAFTSSNSDEDTLESMALISDEHSILYQHNGVKVFYGDPPLTHQIETMNLYTDKNLGKLLVDFSSIIEEESKRYFSHASAQSRSRQVAGAIPLAMKPSIKTAPISA